MSAYTVLLTQDKGLIAHWRHCFAPLAVRVGHALSDLPLIASAGLVWVDLALPGLPPVGDAAWHAFLQSPDWRLIAADSHPRDERGAEYLQAGFVGYCQAYASPPILQQVAQVVQSGQVWVGASLMQRLLGSAKLAAPQSPSQPPAHAATTPPGWANGLTDREREVAHHAAMGASNAAIAAQLEITERTVKAHLSAVFDKLQVDDRLQLALKVHGIR